MTNEERAVMLRRAICSTNNYATKRELILAYADEIRRECAEKAVEHLEGSYDPEAGAWTWTMSGLRAAIMGKEAP